MSHDLNTLCVFIFVYAVTPIPIVVISVASRYQHYGILDEQGNLSLYGRVAWSCSPNYKEYWNNSVAFHLHIWYRIIIEFRVRVRVRVSSSSSSSSCAARFVYAIECQTVSIVEPKCKCLCTLDER